MMDGIQKTVAIALRYLAQTVEEARYGTGDDFDRETFLEDLQDVINLTE